jgi:hypothetical protein
MAYDSPRIILFALNNHARCGVVVTGAEESGYMDVGKRGADVCCVLGLFVWEDGNEMEAWEWCLETVFMLGLCWGMGEDVG